MEVRGSGREIILAAEQAAAAVYGVGAHRLHLNTRRPSVVWPRQLAQYLAMEWGAPPEEIGDHFGRDRTVAYHSRRVVLDQASVYPDLQAKIRSAQLLLEEAIGGGGYSR